LAHLLLLPTPQTNASAKAKEPIFAKAPFKIRLLQIHFIL
jgi:hypothetical protein